jgi:hypothetical protein
VSRAEGELPPVWAFFGYDEPNYTYMKDGRKLLSQLAALSPIPVYIRTHNLLTSGDGTASLKWGSTNAYTEDAQGPASHTTGRSSIAFSTRSSSAECGRWSRSGSCPRR